MLKVRRHGGLKTLRADLALLVTCIKRDVATLNEGPMYYSPPGRKFYERRIAVYREEHKRLSTRLGRTVLPAGRTDGIGHQKPSTPRLRIRVKR